MFVGHIGDQQYTIRGLPFGIGHYHGLTKSGLERYLTPNALQPQYQAKSTEIAKNYK